MLALVVGLVLSIVPGCSGEDSELGRALDGGADGSSADSSNGETELPTGIEWAECEAARLLLFDPVSTPDDEVVPEATVRSAWDELVVTVPVELTDAAELLADVVARDFDDPESVTARDANLALSGLDRLSAWALDACPPVEPVWGCRERSTFRATAARPDGAGDGEAAGPSTGFDSAEAAATGEGDRVEVARTDDEVVFAWLDAEGYAARRITVERGGDGWEVVEEIACDDLDARRSGGPLDPSRSTSTTIVGP